MRFKPLLWAFSGLILLSITSYADSIAGDSHLDKTCVEQMAGEVQVNCRTRINILTVSTATIDNLQVSSLTATSLSTTNFTVNNSTTIGMLRQVVQYTVTSTSNTTVTGSFIPTHLTGAITPSSTGSRIVVLVSGEMQSNAAASTVGLTILRGGSNILGTAGGTEAAPNGSGAWRAPSSIHYVDSPASTSSLTYTVAMAGTSGTTSFCAGSETCTLILAEIR